MSDTNTVSILYNKLIKRVKVNEPRFKPDEIASYMLYNQTLNSVYMERLLNLNDDEFKKALIQAQDVLELNARGQGIVNLNRHELTYYTASVVKGKIVLEPYTRSIYKNDNVALLIKDKHLTKADAQNAIEAVLPKAIEHFKTCLMEYQAVMSKLSFSVGFNYDGDTHGIYNEYEYISFKLDGFRFQFPIGDHD